jgi:hypothetical protein
MALIQVTQDMIDSSTCMDPRDCALANGIKHHLGPDADVHVDYDCIEFRDRDANGTWRLLYLFPTPTDCQRFMHEFDSGQAEPFEVRIPIPLSLLRKAAQ